MPPTSGGCGSARRVDLTDGVGRARARRRRRGAPWRADRRRSATGCAGRRPSPRLVVVQALARGGRDEDAVEAMTEVGVDEVIGWSARAQRRAMDRAHAGEVDGDRAMRPPSSHGVPGGREISGPATTADVAARCAAADLAIVLHEAATAALVGGSVVPAAGEVVVVVVGPEGGITDDELRRLRRGRGARRPAR